MGSSQFQLSSLAPDLALVLSETACMDRMASLSTEKMTKSPIASAPPPPPPQFLVAKESSTVSFIILWHSRCYPLLPEILPEIGIERGSLLLLAHPACPMKKKKIIKKKIYVHVTWSCDLEIVYPKSSETGSGCAWTKARAPAQAQAQAQARERGIPTPRFRGCIGLNANTQLSHGVLPACRMAVSQTLRFPPGHFRALRGTHCAPRGKSLPPPSYFLPCRT